MPGERYKAGCPQSFIDLVDGLKRLPTRSSECLGLVDEKDCTKQAPCVPCVNTRDRQFEYVTRIYSDLTPRLTDAQLAYWGCVDRYFLLVELLNRKDDVYHPWVFARCREVEVAPDDHIDLWARWHGKSSVITYAGVIQEIVNDPEITIAIVAATHDIARPFVEQIKAAFETNERLKRIYADVLWKNPRSEAKGAWSADDGITVKRKTAPKERTLEPVGLIDGNYAGRHWRLMVYDDLVTDTLVTNEDMIRKTTTKFELSTNLGSGQSARRQIIGTRYSMGDTYGHILNQGIAIPRVYPATHNGKRSGRPVFMRPESWEKVKREQGSTLAAQMLQNPLEGSNAMFDPRQLRPYHLRPRVLNVYIMGDPSQGIRSRRSDRTAIVVIGVDGRGNKYLLDGYCHRMKLSERWQNLKQLYTKWAAAPGVQMCRVGWERYGMQADIQYFEIEMSKKDNPYFEIVELNWTREGNESKTARMQRLEPDFGNNAFLLPAKVFVTNARWKERGQTMVGPRVCTWRVDDENGDIDFIPIAKHPETGMINLTKQERQAKQVGERYLLIEPIRRRNEEGRIYDLTRIFFEEHRMVPLAVHDDLMDITSRIYDMDPVPAIVIDKTEWSTPIYDMQETSYG